MTVLSNKYMDPSLGPNVTTGRIPKGAVVSLSDILKGTAKAAPRLVEKAAPKATGPVPVKPAETPSPSLDGLVEGFRKAVGDRDSGNSRETVLKDFSPSPVYRDPSLAYKRREGLLPGVVRKLQSTSTYYPAETYGFAKDRPGNYVIAFGGADSGVGAGNGPFTEQALDRRYGQGRYALFTPQQVPQALAFAKALPKGSRIHVTGHSQGGGAVPKFLKGLGEVPDDFVHSVHLYDAVSDFPLTEYMRDFPYKDRTKHFVPSMAVPANTSDYWSYAGGKAGRIPGVRNIPLTATHREVWTKGQETASAPPIEERAAVYPLAHTSFSDLSPYDKAAVVPDNPQPSVPQRFVAASRNAVTGENEAGFNVNGGYGLLRPGVGAAPAFNLSSPSKFMRSYGIAPQDMRNPSFAPFYRDARADAVLSASSQDETLQPFTREFLNAARSVTSTENPSVMGELMRFRDPRKMEASVGAKVEQAIADVMERQNPGYARQGYGVLLQGLQRDINRLYMRAQMASLQKREDQATGYVHAAALSQMLLGKLTDALRRKYAEGLSFQMPELRKFHGPDLTDIVRNSLGLYYRNKARHTR